MKIRTRQRGSLMLGMSAIILITGAFCATVLVRSLETYGETARLEQTFQLLAAAEGAAVLAKNGAPAQPVSVGRCVVTIDAATTTPQTLVVEMRRPNGAVIAARRFAIDTPGSTKVRPIP